MIAIGIDPGKYDSLEGASNNLAAKLRKAFGIVGDKE